MTRRKTTEEFIKEAIKIHGNQYIYDCVMYTDSLTDVIIFCKIHGYFLVNSGEHIHKKYGCKKCGDLNRTLAKFYTNEELVIKRIEFIEKCNIIYNNKYIYNDLIFLNVDTKGKVICPKHGEFDIRLSHHLSGVGCSLCSKIKRLNEKAIEKFLLNNDIKFKHEFSIKLPVNITKRSKSFIDFYIFDYNLFVEYHGAQHYKPIRFGGMLEQEAVENFKHQQLRDQQLREYCENNNINLLEIDGRIYHGKKLEKFLYENFK